MVHLTAKEIKASQSSGADARRLMLEAGDDEASSRIATMQNKRNVAAAPKPKNHQLLYRKSLQEMERKKKEEEDDMKNRSDIAKATRDRIKPKNVRNATSKVFGEGMGLGNMSVSVDSLEFDENFDVDGGSGATIATGQTGATRNFLQENRSLASRRSSTNGRMSSLPPEPKHKEEPRHSSFGKVPSYLQNRKAEWAQRQQEAEALIEKEKSGIPDGQVLMKEEDRLAVLKDLTVKLDDLYFQLRKLPIARRTMSTEAKREQLEKEIQETEYSIEVFSQEKVYVLEDSETEKIVT